MAVIQALPLELLRRILELLATDRRPQKDLYNATLVARAWRHPSQSLLIYHMDLLDVTRSTDALRLNAGCTLRLVNVDWRNAREILSALHENDISVETLGMYATRHNDLDMSTMSLKLLAGLKSLRLGGHFQGHPTISPDTKLELTKLTVHTDYLPSLAFFDSILPAAPFLTSLELYVGDDGELLPTEYTSPFRGIAHQLRHLTIYTGVSCHPTSRASLNDTRFVASCTSLESLELCNCGTDYIRDVASAVRAPLCVLETQMASGWNDGGTGVAELASVLELPAMAKFKRWRMCKRRLYGASLDKEETAQWEAVCRARGVEPRDETRFFTGKTTLLSSYPIKTERWGLRPLSVTLARRRSSAAAEEDVD
uniref:F-box domain-containing protein n=1 Tax=Leucosporidium scottii TaxID=5278 RepID=A0A0H5FU13_9BASI|nr:hypothetical protein [Leucosporidium scottii]